MPRRKQAVLPAGLKRLRERIEQWRRTRERRTRMPEELWSEAVALGKREGAYRVAKTLRLNFDGLRRRIAEAADTPTPAAPQSQFIELTGAQLLDPSAAGPTVEMQDERGTRLVVKGAPVDVEKLVAAFRRA